MIERGHELHLAVRRDSPLIDSLTGYPIRWYELGLRNALDIISAQGLANMVAAVFIEQVPDSPEWWAVADRLRRAAHEGAG